MKRYQEITNTWIKEHGVRYFNELTNMVVLMEEVGELARYISRVYGEQSFKISEDEQNAKEKIKEELADIQFVVLCLANQMDIDLEEAFDKKLAVKTIRDKERHLRNKKIQ
jgi:NTP pyrophosphatase (non-canonical NTP hydrolase)